MKGRTFVLRDEMGLKPVAHVLVCLSACSNITANRSRTIEDSSIARTLSIPTHHFISTTLSRVLVEFSICLLSLDFLLLLVGRATHHEFVTLQRGVVLLKHPVIAPHVIEEMIEKSPPEGRVTLQDGKNTPLQTLGLNTTLLVLVEPSGEVSS